MRQLLIQVPRGHGKDVLDIAKSHDGSNLAQFEATGSDGPIDVVIGRWEMVIRSLFLLLLQLVGINLSASIVFRAYGLSTLGARYNRGKWWVFPATLAVTVVTLLGLLTWQFWSPPQLQRPSRAQRANAEIQKVVNKSGVAELVEANVRFTGPNIKGQNTLLGIVYVQRRTGVTQSSEEIRDRITRAIQTHLLEQGFNVTPLIDVSVLEVPNSK
jgi:uncharacterized membrane protein